VLGLARHLANDSGGIVGAVPLGQDTKDLAAGLIVHSAYRVYVVDGATFAAYQTDA
jgi:electron transfer flavoprotein alpha subunit